MKQWSFLLGLILFGSLFTACATATPTPVPPTPVPPTAVAKPTAAPSPVVLKLEGLSSTKSLTLADVKALPATEGWAGIKSSTGRITVPDVYKGVSIAALVQTVGGMNAESGVTLTAKDGYAMTISYDQITKGDFITYDPAPAMKSKSKTRSPSSSRTKKPASRWMRQPKAR